MDSSPTGHKAAVADYLAAERTLLAWVRTGLALMGFGFVVARFGLFLQQLAAIQHTPAQQSYGLSLWFGTALIAAGVVVTLASALRHIRMVYEFDHGSDDSVHSVIQAVAIAVFLGLVGIAMAIYLLSVRNSTNSHSEITQEVIMATAANTTKVNNGIVTLPSLHSVDETVQKLTAILESKGVTLFALVDHSGEAEKVGLKMPNTKLLIFGSPKAGTPLMLAAPSIAIDLPLKILVSEDTQGMVWISYNNPEYLQQRHGLPPNLLSNIAVVGALASAAAQ
ncbi:MAG: DUF302 domain-containing protein [Candidatus Korobacteraceae bacterium]|jgi:uncharacterized protein (DUF302 family)/uncharacterized membrane protein YidH (DUF202 family)